MNAVDSETARASYMARVNYNYASKYLVEFNIRRDGSENLHLTNGGEHLLPLL